MRHLLAALCCLGALAPCAFAGPTELTLEGSAPSRVQGFFTEISSGLLGATESRPEARTTLMGLAIMPRILSDELKAFATRANETGKVRTIELTGFEVDVTAWYGVLPLERVRLFFWMGGEELRVLKFDRDENHKVELFRPPTASQWVGPVPEAFGELAQSVLTLPAADQCGRLPTVRPAHVFKRKGDPKARGFVEAEAERAAQNCAAMAGTPFNRITWKLGQVSGVVTTQKKQKLGFGFELLAGPDRGVRLYRLTRPQAAR